MQVLIWPPSPITVERINKINNLQSTNQDSPIAVATATRNADRTNMALTSRCPNAKVKFTPVVHGVTTIHRINKD